MSGSSNDQLFCLNDQGGSVMSVTENRTGTLRSEEHGHSPCVCLDMTHACDVIRKAVYIPDKAHSLRANGADPHREDAATYVAVNCRNGSENENVNGTLS